MNREIRISKSPLDLKIEFHRNGVGGEGFHVVLFKFYDGEYDGPSHFRPMIATVFPARGHVAVIDMQATGAGDITSKWRGDVFEQGLREAIKAWEDSQNARILG